MEEERGEMSSDGWEWGGRRLPNAPTTLGQKEETKEGKERGKEKRGACLRCHGATPSWFEKNTSYSLFEFFL